MSQDEKPGERLTRLVRETNDPNLGLALEKGLDPLALDEMEMESLDDLARAFLKSYGVIVP